MKSRPPFPTVAGKKEEDSVTDDYMRVGSLKANVSQVFCSICVPIVVVLGSGVS